MITPRPSTTRYEYVVIMMPSLSGDVLLLSPSLPYHILALHDITMSTLLQLTAVETKQELEFQTSPAICIESLIAINKKVGQPQAALGILKYAQNNLPVSVREDWLSKLGHWEVGYVCG